MSTIAVIPARGGSTRIPRKNIKSFFGKPIIAYSIEKARESTLFDRIVVSTDDVEIAAVARQYDAEVWMRDPVFGDNEVGTQEVVRECLKGIKAIATDLVCCIYATAPLMRVSDLVHGNILVKREKTDYVFTVGYPPLGDAGQFYWGEAGLFLDHFPLISPRTRLLHVPSHHVCDINTLDDWYRAESLYQEITE